MQAGAHLTLSYRRLRAKASAGNDYNTQTWVRSSNQNQTNSRRTIPYKALAGSAQATSNSSLEFRSRKPSVTLVGRIPQATDSKGPFAFQPANTVSEATLYKWKAKYGDMDVPEAKRLKQPWDENAKPKKLLVEQMLDAAALHQLLPKTVGPAAERQGVAHLIYPVDIPQVA